MLSEISQPQKDKYRMIPLIQGPQRSQIHRDTKEKGVCQGLREEGGGLVFDRAEVQFGKMKYSGDDGGDGCTALWLYLMPLNCTLTMG